MTPVVIKEASSVLLAYATFWQRFAAMMIDAVVLVVAAYPLGWLSGQSQTMATLLVIPYEVGFIAYVIYCHGHFGRTVGKHVMGIRVARLDGSPIGWNEAWKRSVVDFLITLVGVAGSFWILAQITPAEFAAAERVWFAAPLFPAHEPIWFDWAETAYTVWALSEIVVMLMNKERRALHDFIAGTIVVQGRS